MSTDVHRNTNISSLAAKNDVNIQANAQNKFNYEAQKGSWVKILDSNNASAGSDPERFVLCDLESVHDADLLRLITICIQQRAPLGFLISDANHFLKIIPLGEWAEAHLDERFGDNLVRPEGATLSEQIDNLAATIEACL